MSNKVQSFTKSLHNTESKVYASKATTSTNGARDDSSFQEQFTAKPAHYSAKEVIYNEGTTVASIIVIRSGMVKLVSHLPNGRARIVRVHSSGSWLGLCGLLGRPFEHTAIAIDDVDGYHIPVSKLLQIKSDNPYLYNQLLEHWFDYLQDADMWIAEFSTGVIKARVARLVNFLSDIENNNPFNEVRLLKCEEMAEILGATPESVSRVLAEFKRDKVLYPSRFTNGDNYECDETALDTIAQH